MSIIVSTAHPQTYPKPHTYTPSLPIRITGRTLDITFRRLEAEPDTRGVASLSSLVHAACDATGLKQKVFMTALRHALTAMKVGPVFSHLLS